MISGLFGIVARLCTQCVHGSSQPLPQHAECQRNWHASNLQFSSGFEKKKVGLKVILLSVNLKAGITKTFSLVMKKKIQILDKDTDHYDILQNFREINLFEQIFTQSVVFTNFFLSWCNSKLHITSISRIFFSCKF